MKAKKPLIIGGIILDVAIICFLFVVSIIMLVTMPETTSGFEQAEKLNGPFIGYLQRTTHEGSPLYFLCFVLPLFLLLAANIVILVIYVKKAGNKKELAVDDLNNAQKEALKAQLLKDLSGEAEEK